MAVIIQMRRDVSTTWGTVNPVLNSGEFGVETDTLKIKVGNGTDTWNNLPYINDANELDLTDITDWPTGVTATEVGYLDGVTSAIQTQLNNRVSTTQLGVANGVATLGSDGKVPAGQLPSYVDDVLEYLNQSQFPAIGEPSKIYVDITSGKIYRWSGSVYVAVSDAASTADQATKLTTTRTISATGDVTGSTSFDGSQNVSAELTLSNTGVGAGTYKSVTVDAKGRVTAGTNPTTLAGYGITDAATSTHTHSNATTSTSGFMSATDKTKLDSISENAEVNQNAFSSIAVAGQTTVTADAKTDTLTLVAGTNIAITSDSATDSITINAADSVGSADTLTTARTIALGGDLSGSASFDGSQNITITAAIQPDSVVLGTDTTGNYVADITAGSYITKSGTAGEGWSPSIAVNAATTNTPSTVVARDASGNFSAGTITAALSGNASTATSLATGRTISATGDVTWTSQSFDGSANVTGTATLANSGVTAGTYKSVTVDAKGRVTAGTNPTTLSGYGITDAVNTSVLGAANGVATLDSDGKVPANQLPSYVDDVVEAANLASLPGTGETGKIYVAQDTGKIYRWSGSAYIEISASAGTSDEALKLTTARSIAATGDASWSVSFDGSQNVSSTLTLANSGVTAGTYKSVTVDAKGRVTAGTNPTTLSGYGITDAQPLDADLTSIAALAGTSGFLKKTAANTWSLDTNTYLTANQKITLSGDLTGSGTTSISATLSNSGVTAGTYKSVTVDAKGRVTAGTNPTTLAGYGITDAATSTHTHGDISNTGTITSAAVAPADTDYILISDTSASGAVKRGIAIGTSTTTFLRNDGTWATAGSGSVTSVALSLPAMFTVTGSPITSSGTLTATLASQAANTVFAAPNGAAGSPTFRALVAADIPSLDAAKITTGTLGTARGGTGLTSFTQGGVLYASSASALASTGAGTTGQVLTSNGTGAPTWTTISGGATLSNDTSTNATYYPVFTTATTGSMTTAKVSSTKLQFNPSTGQLNATAFNSLSDRSAKTNVQTISHGLADVLKSNPVDFDWKDGSGSSFGFIAQELEAIIPKAVSTDENGISSVNYSILTAVLFKAVQELSSEVERLREQITGEWK